jgi:hypothetical protein
MHLPNMFRASSTDLVPVTPPVAVYREHVATVPTTLVLKEKAWSMSGVSLAFEGWDMGREMGMGME